MVRSEEYVARVVRPYSGGVGEGIEEGAVSVVVEVEVGGRYFPEGVKSGVG